MYQCGGMGRRKFWASVCNLVNWSYRLRRSRQRWNVTVIVMLYKLITIRWVHKFMKITALADVISSADTSNVLNQKMRGASEFFCTIAGVTITQDHLDS